MVMPVYLNDVVQPRSLNYFLLLSRTSNTNSDICSYSFAVSQAQPLYNINNATVNTITIKFPSLISLSIATCSSCSIDIIASTVTFDVVDSFSVLTVDNVINAYSN